MGIDATTPRPPGVIGPGQATAFPAAPMYGATSLDTPLLRLAFLGRVSDEDLQDPTLSIPRQLANCTSALPPGASLVAHFWDVESGRRDLDERGMSRAHERFEVNVPRDGGINDMLALARSPRRPFDAVICESIDRVARRTYFGVKVEYDLERAGVVLVAADEGITNLRKRATTILTRRVKQATAEWYVLDTLEKAWDGFCEHATQGWNIGVPPYGYRADRIPHPVPAKRSEGQHKTRLALDPLRAPVVRQIFAWRVTERLSARAIADRLNADPDRFPPPEAIGGTRSRGSWSHRSVRSLLLNPKYTGYMVWNRRARTTPGAPHNPPEQWVWSREPSHEPIVSLDTYRAASATRARTRSGAEANTHPLTKRTYLLRSYVVCALCGRRMEGATRRERAYFSCQPHRNRGRGAHEAHERHAQSIWIAQDRLLGGIVEFFAERVFGPNRHEQLARDLSDDHTAAQAAWHERTTALEEAVAEVAARRQRLIQVIETTDDPEGTLTADVGTRLGELVATEQTRRELLRTHLALPVRGLRCQMGLVAVGHAAWLSRWLSSIWRGVRPRMKWPWLRRRWW